MRRILGLLAVVAMLQVATGCRHVAGACDCEHAPLQNRYTNGNGASGCKTCGGDAVTPADGNTSTLGIYAPAPAPAPAIRR
jgi:hypothetical protein